MTADLSHPSFHTLRKLVIAGVVGLCLAVSVGSARDVQAEVATREQRLALVSSGMILPAATLVAMLEAAGGEVLDMDLYLPSSDKNSWCYQVMYRSANGRVVTINLNAIDGSLMVKN